MPDVTPPWRRCVLWREAPGWLGRGLEAARKQFALGGLVGLLVLLLAGSAWPDLAWADSGPSPQAYRCDGDPLTALLVKGPMDDPSIPDPSTAPVPVGGSVVLAWRGLSLQLPRTNNAGPASFSDGKWWWSLEDPTHPRFRLRRPLGDIQDFACELAASGLGPLP